MRSISRSDPKVLTLVCAQDNLHEEVRRWDEGAIAVLEMGDLECRIRADMLRGELEEYTLQRARSLILGL